MSAGNPATAQMARQVIDALSKRGAGPSTSGGAGGSQPPEMATHLLGSRMNELQGADPAALLRKLMQMKSDTVEMIPQVAFTLPGISKHLTKLWQALDGAIKEAEQALSTAQSINSLPIGLSAAKEGGESGGDQQPRGGSPFMPGSVMGQ